MGVKNDNGSVAAMRNSKRALAAAPTSTAVADESIARILNDNQRTKELAEDGKWLRSLVETTRIIAWEADVATWCFTYVGSCAVEILGYPIADWFKEGFWVDHIHPEDRAAAIKVCKEGTRRHKRFELEYRMLAADGRTVWFHDIVQVVRGPRGPEIIKGFLIDITERKRVEDALRESEERSRLALQASATGTFEIDLVSGEAHWNAVEFELLGMKPGDAPPGPETFFRYVHPDDVALLRAQWEKAKRTGQFRAEFRVVRADGEVRWLGGKGGFAFENKAGTPASRSGQPSRFLGVNFDITERRRLEAELLEIGDRERQRIGHDLHDGLGQKLTALEMKCFLLLEDLADVPVKGKRLQAQVRQLGRALRTCTTMSRSLARGLAPVSAAPSGLMDALKQLAHSTHSVRNIQCHFFCDAGGKLDDPQAAGHLYRIAQEAVNNALKHGQPRRIDIRLERRQHALRLRIKDDGRGFAIRKRNRPGMGLEIMHHRAQVIGATLRINSKPGCGVVVICTLPLKK